MHQFSFHIYFVLPPKSNFSIKANPFSTAHCLSDIFTLPISNKYQSEMAFAAKSILASLHQTMLDIGAGSAQPSTLRNTNNVRGISLLGGTLVANRANHSS